MVLLRKHLLIPFIEQWKDSKRNNSMGTERSTDRRFTGEGVRVTGVTYQCSSPADTGKGAYEICSPDPNIHSPLNA